MTKVKLYTFKTIDTEFFCVKLKLKYNINENSSFVTLTFCELYLVLSCQLSMYTQKVLFDSISFYEC